MAVLTKHKIDPETQSQGFFKNSHAQEHEKIHFLSQM